VDHLFLLRLTLAVALLGTLQSRLHAAAIDLSLEVVVSVAEQRLALVEDGVIIKKFRISTSKFGLGDGLNSYKTPLGRLRVCMKLGDDLPVGAVFKRRHFSGEVIPKNARGRDPIVTRILWLEGIEPGNKNARTRCIYIHGTPQEQTIGTASSFGCVRMRSDDVIEVFDAVPIGTAVTIMAGKLPRTRYSGPFKFLVFGHANRVQERS
jgi:lipoprotein-anchoring transpeptidase ErfK/SrfK